ncbi:hypothetical protein C900_05486 [Fulvivirga imtechensis AK7]|uniref:Uncharacterized protein n=1 Tax=Fulvivirga imtechensis AK7 TaxID=1237149 RepID=L8JNZ0_9BACT|nr:hypothetical protein C900_05486 [Fulvivirga imtechensis AK7]
MIFSLTVTIVPAPLYMILGQPFETDSPGHVYGRSTGSVQKH